MLGLDLSESTVRAVVIDDGGRVLARTDHEVASGGPAQAVKEAVKRARGAAGKNLSSVGFATLAPGEAPGSDILAALADAVPGQKAMQVSSGIAAVVAETWCGAARGVDDVVAFSIGEHVTAGVIIGGKVWTGAHGYAASVSWLAMNPVEREDYRRYGGLEAEIAGAGIVRRLVWRIKSGDRSNILDQVGGDLARITADHVFQAARNGDGVSISVVRDTAKYAGMAVSNLATVLDPAAIVLGGTLASAGDMMLEAIRIECSRRLNPPQAERVKIVLSTLGADAVAIGAARTAALQSA
jgi:predicted NBD/HSP70 family sugar kinase